MRGVADGLDGDDGVDQQVVVEKTVGRAEEGQGGGEGAREGQFADAGEAVEEEDAGGWVGMRGSGVRDG